MNERRPGETSTASPDGVWRPYEDPPLLAPELAQGLAEDRRVAALRRYLLSLVTARAAPVHVAVAFNGAFFGFDTLAGGYPGGPLEFDRFPEVAHGSVTGALPVGAMVRVGTGAALVPGEVVYKEGAHPDCGPEGDVPAWLSGAPADAVDPGHRDRTEAAGPVESRERLVVDTDAFGAGLVRPAQVHRLRRKNRLDEFGHLTVTARHPRERADGSELEHYIHHMLTTGRELLLSELAPMSLTACLPPGSHDGAALEMALRGLLTTVSQVLRSLESETRMWGYYAFTRKSFTARMQDGGPMGGQVLESMVVSAAKAAVPRDRSGTAPAVYTALGTALRSRQDGALLLQGTAYPLAVCHAHALAADLVTRETDETTGLLHSPEGVRLRLDDRWQGGGVWRAEYRPPGSREPMHDDAGLPVDVPLGRGWWDSAPRTAEPPVETPVVVPHSAPARPEGLAGRPAEAVPESGPELPPTSQDEPANGALPSPPSAMADATPPRHLPGPDQQPAYEWPEDEDLDDCRLVSVADSQISWSQSLRLSHTVEGFLPIPARILKKAPDLPEETSLRLVLRHEGHGLDPDDTDHDTTLESHRGQYRLTGFEWPLIFYPGLILRMTHRYGSRAINAETMLLSAPETVDGELIEHCYDRRVLTRDGACHSRRSPLRTADLSPERLLLGTVRRLGLLDNYGRAMLPGERLLDAVRQVFPGTRGGQGALKSALGRMLADGILITEHGSEDSHGRLHYPPQSREKVVRLVCYVPERRPVSSSVTAGRNGGAGGRFAGRRSGHQVNGHLRKLPPGQRASDGQRAAYRRDRELLGMTDAELPPRHTYVPPHQRSG
ncbi:hypothetical protein [Streptomyces aidingensis]|uniref:Uncharacterized protein n=1 Tax=Streptomyces aidingensis TaxID=910347 RepID=A0A1I1MBU2_9ACTN|nr:hypothetical protein [Streptomyces aidingensis]SFC82834.1 hypothetical protein SAMN05421773_106186 [Streptomyces aidingensis]